MNEIYHLNTKLIEDFIKENNLTISKFCKLCKITPATLKNLQQGKDCRFNSAIKIAKAMKVNPSDIILI